TGAVISTTPTSVSFSGTAGGVNPPSQTLTISNSGTGTLTWTASSNAAWLTLSPTSGTAPSSTTVSVNTAGLAAGTYNGAITITAFDTLKVQLRNSAGTVLTTLATYSNLNASTFASYSQQCFNVGSYAGQTVRPYFLGTEDSSLKTSFFLDDTGLQ